MRKEYIPPVLPPHVYKGEILWGQGDALEICAECDKHTLQYCYRDPLCFELISELNLYNSEQWELHVHPEDHMKKYVVYMTYRKAEGGKTHVTFAAPIPEEALRSAIRRVKPQVKSPPPSPVHVEAVEITTLEEDVTHG